MDQSDSGVDTNHQSSSESEKNGTGSGEKEGGKAEETGAAGKEDVLVDGDAGDSSKPDDVAPSSPKVQFDEGTKTLDGGVKALKTKKKRSFKDLVLKDVIATEQGDAAHASGLSTPQKSILKVRSEPLLPSLQGDQQSHSFVNQAYDGGDSDGDTPTGARAKKASLGFLKRTASTGSGRGFADVVDLLIQRSSIDLGGRDMHPFGRDCSIEGIMQASQPKSHSKNSAVGKLVIWMTLLSILMGAACGIIFLSETYNSKQREEMILMAKLNLSSS